MGGLRTVAKRLIARSAAVAIVGGLVAAPMALADPTPVFYPQPSGQGIFGSSGIVTDPSGNVWFTSDYGFSGPPPVGKLVPASAQDGTSNGMSFYNTVTGGSSNAASSQLRSLAYDNTQNKLWFVRSDGVYGFGDPSQFVAGTSAAFSAAQVPSKVGLWGIAVNQSTHDVWFAENDSNNSGGYTGERLARTDSGLALQEAIDLANQGAGGAFSSLRYDAKPLGVSIAPDGTPWFAEADPGYPGYRVGRVNGVGAGSTYTEWCLVAVDPCHGPGAGGSGANDTAVASNGTVWFTVPAENIVGSLDPSTGTINKYVMTQFSSSLSAGQPKAVRFASDGTLWVTEYGGSSHTSANAMVRLTIGSGGVAANVFPTGTWAPLAVAPSVTGDLWFTAQNVNSAAIGVLKGAIGGGTDPGTTPTPTPGPGTPTPAPGTPTPTPKPSTITDPGVTAAPTFNGVFKPANPSPQGNDLSLTQICVGPPQDKCSLIYLLQTHEYVTGFPGSGARLSAKPKKTKTDKKHQTIGGLSVVLNGGDSKQILVPLSAKAKKALKKQGHIKAILTVSQVIDAAGHTKVVQTKNVTFKYKKPKKGH